MSLICLPTWLLDWLGIRLKVVGIYLHLFWRHSSIALRLPVLKLRSLISDPLHETICSPLFFSLEVITASLCLIFIMMCFDVFIFIHCSGFLVNSFNLQRTEKTLSIWDIFLNYMIDDFFPFIISDPTFWNSYNLDTPV